MKETGKGGIEDKVCRYARDRYGMLTFKFTSTARRGVPDRLFVTPEGLIMFVEFKAPGQKLSEPQRRTLDALAAYRCECAVIRDVERGKQLVDLISNADNYAAFMYELDSEQPAPVPTESH